MENWILFFIFLIALLIAILASRVFKNKATDALVIVLGTGTLEVILWNSFIINWVHTLSLYFPFFIQILIGYIIVWILIGLGWLFYRVVED